MSSRYSAICINHTPALIINEMDDYRSADEAMAEARHGPHRDCTLMVGRYSGALVEIGCPPDRYHPRHTKWVDAVWLHIAAEALVVETSALQAALRRLHPCFHAERLLRLRRLLVEHKPGGPDDAPTLSEVTGLLADLTEGKSATEWLREQRGGTAAGDG